MRRLSGVRVLGIVMATAVATGGIVACGSSDSDPSTGSNGGSASAATASSKKSVTMLFSAPFGNGYTDATLKGIKDYAAENDVKVISRDSTLDPTKQYAQLQDAIASQQFDAVVMIPLDGVGVVPAVKRAVDQDIDVATTDFALGPDIANEQPQVQVQGQAAAIYDTYAMRGQQMAKAWIEACRGIDPCEGAFLTGVAALPWEKVVLQTLKAGIKGHPNIRFTAFQETGSYATADATPIARNVLQAHPNLTVLSSVTDPIAHGWELAAKDAGVAEKVKIIGIGASSYGVDAVRAGRWFATVLSLPYDEGKLGAEYATKAARGAGAPNGVAESAAAKSGLPLLLTKETLPADFKGQWAA